MERRHDIDWLRIIAILLVLYFHTAMLFNAHSDWHIQNTEKSELWGEFNFWLSRFRMPLLFFVSGFGTFLALRKRSPWQYIKERHNRLVIPLVFSMLVIVPPQIYFERISNGSTFSYVEFYPTIFAGIPYPEGNLSWHHMWFVLYLFFYSILGLPVFLFLRSAKGQRFTSYIISKTAKFHGILILMPTVLLASFWTYWNDSTNDFIHDTPWHAYWFSFFFMGYFTGTSEKIWTSIVQNRHTYLRFALLGILLINIVRWNGHNSNLFFEIHPVLGYMYLGLFAANAWFWLLTALGYGKKYLNRSHKILPYANSLIYPFYIVHQTIIIIIGFYVIRTEESILAKYIFISTLSLIGSIAIYEFIIRPNKIMRFVFGVKETVKTPVKKIPSLKTRTGSKAA